MRKYLIRFHLYAGLLCFPYFIIFGVSSLNINHHFKFMEPSADSSIRWQGRINIPNFKNNQQFADDIRDSLQLMGWTPPWEQETDSVSFRFEIVHAATKYNVTVPVNKKTVLVEEKRKGFWPVFNSLHFLGEKIPGAPAMINLWRFYQNITVFVMLFSILSGIYIFLRRKSERKTGLIILFTSLALSLLIMISVWL